MAALILRNAVSQEDFEIPYKTYCRNPVNTWQNKIEFTADSLPCWTFGCNVQLQLLYDGQVVGHIQDFTTKADEENAIWMNATDQAFSVELQPTFLTHLSLSRVVIYLNMIPALDKSRLDYKSDYTYPYLMAQQFAQSVALLPQLATEMKELRKRKQDVPGTKEVCKVYLFLLSKRKADDTVSAMEDNPDLMDSCDTGTLYTLEATFQSELPRKSKFPCSVTFRGNYTMNSLHPKSQYRLFYSLDSEFPDDMLLRQYFTEQVPLLDWFGNQLPSFVTCTSCQGTPILNGEDDFWNFQVDTSQLSQLPVWQCFFAQWKRKDIMEMNKKFCAVIDTTKQLLNHLSSAFAYSEQYECSISPNDTTAS